MEETLAKFELSQLRAGVCGNVAGGEYDDEDDEDDPDEPGEAEVELGDATPARCQRKPTPTPPKVAKQAARGAEKPSEAAKQEQESDDD